MDVSMYSAEDSLDMLMCPTQLSDDEAADMQDDEQFEAEDYSWEEHMPDKENIPAACSPHFHSCQCPDVLAASQCFNESLSKTMPAQSNVQNCQPTASLPSRQCQVTIHPVQHSLSECKLTQPQIVLHPPDIDNTCIAMEHPRSIIGQPATSWSPHRHGETRGTQHITSAQPQSSELERNHILQPTQPMPEHSSSQQKYRQQLEVQIPDTAQLQRGYCHVPQNQNQHFIQPTPSIELQTPVNPDTCHNQQLDDMQCHQHPNQPAVGVQSDKDYSCPNSCSYIHLHIPDQPPCSTSIGKLLSLSCSVEEWLSELHLQHYLPNFTEHEVDTLAVPLMRDEDLLAIGIMSSHDRQLMLSSASQLRTAYELPPDFEALLASISTLLSGSSSYQPGDSNQGTMHATNPVHSHTLHGGPCEELIPMQQPRVQQRWSARTEPKSLTVHQHPQQQQHRQQQQQQQQQEERQQQPMMHSSSNCTNSVSDQEVAPLHPMFRPQVVNNAHRITSFFTSFPPQPTHVGRQPSKVVSNSPENWSADGMLHGPPVSKAGKRSSSPLKSWNHASTCNSNNDQNRPDKKGKGLNSDSNKVISMPGSLQRPTCTSEGSRFGGGQQRLAGLPEWHTLPGTRFPVDYFGPGSSKVSGSNGVWILTHFHADHYKGLSRKFPYGTVLCSPITAKLVETRLKLPVNKLRPVPLHEPHTIDGVTLTLVDANHCPGAAMVIAEVPGKPPVLHTGDCRLSVEVRQQPALQALRGKGAVLVLDTTYCDPQYCFPTQQETIDYTMKAVKSELFNSRALFVFGTYTIGKERLFLEVAHTLGKKVYMNKDKMQVLQCCNLAPSYLQLLTTNHLETNFHVVPLQKVNLQGLEEILANYKGRYNTIIGFQPTGWAMQRQASKTSCGRRVQKGTIVLHSVPYSEHSSFRELHQFCEWLLPSRIIPSVGNDGSGAARDKMLNLLRQPLPKLANTGNPPITKFFGKAQPAAV